ncbi:5'-nucleotidase C-terminal domain-containing protein [Streptomyces lydicamycinicus]|uniref:5'-nucleotidase C-terminal domain-containing protein n=1 Tax=Streptomyces lydicamycinicus TaxID=1546107 RepID=UPI002554C870|nr:5'-nucleotidase C-terminal domain-containing protein [Streptomyces lydicamycinicus]
MPDDDYDVSRGVSYEVDIAKSAGQRIGKLMFDGKPSGDATRFVPAVKNYRASGGGNFPRVAAAERGWSASDGIRKLMIGVVGRGAPGRVRGTGEVDPAVCASVDRKLTRGGVPVF